MDRPGSVPDRPRDLGWVAVIGGLGLSLRLAYALQYTGHPLGRWPWVDEGAYWTQAQAILGGAWLPERPFYQDPLYPYLLAALMRMVGTDVASLRVALACLGSLTPLAVFWAGRRGLGRAEGIVAGLVMAAYGPLVFTDGQLEKEGAGALVAALGLWLAARAASRPRSHPAFGCAGLAWGILALLRANALVIGPLGAAWCLWTFACTVGGRRRSRALCFLIGFGIPLAPVAVVNALVSPRPELILTTWQAGPNFYVGNGPGATGTYWAPDFVEANPAREADDFAAEARRRTGRPLSPGQVSRFWLAEGLARWRAAPGASLRLLAWKLGLVAHDFEIPDNQSMEVVRLVVAPALACGVFSFGWLAPWAALALGRSGRSPFWWFLAASTVAGLASTAVFFVVGRYRIPWAPGLALLAAAGVVDASRRAADGRWRSLAARVLLLAAPAMMLAWRPIANPVPDRWGHSAIGLALAYLAADRLEPAIDALDDSRAIGSGPAARVAELLAIGPMHDKMAWLAATSLDTARRLRFESNTSRARWLRQLPEGRPEARRLLEAALRSNPGDARARREWACWWLGEAGNPAARRRAAEELHRAASPPSRDAEAAILLALLTGDPGPLGWPTVRGADRLSPRLRLARAILAAFAPMWPPLIH